MIKNIWKNIELYCGNHPVEETPIQMTIQNGPSSLFYSCPKYYPQNREKMEKACSNRISLEDFDSLVVKVISEKVEENEINNIKEDLTGLEWTKKNINFKITEYKDGKYKVRMLNKKALR